MAEPAPQPPAGAATVKYSCDLHQDCVNKLAPHYNQKPAAPPVSGDEAVVREIVNRHVSAGYCCFTNAMVAVREALERGRALGARDCGHDLATIATDAHGMGQENVTSNVMDWLIEEGADDLVRKLETGEWHKVAMNARRSGGQGK